MTHPLLVWLEERLEAKERQGLNGTIRFDSLIEVGDPEGDLALVEAHRMILSLHKPDEWGNCSDPCISNWSWAEDVQYEAWPCPTVRALASAYQHAPGYDPSWGPSEETERE